MEQKPLFNSLYRCNRSRYNEMILLMIKRYTDRTLLICIYVCVFGDLLLRILTNVAVWTQRDNR